ncbi:LysR family transcriptional regulator [Morganella morganii]|uniref:LysR family transcriptional regulator n=1 Tax=Morganella morganii TaxID=582 RepID=A0A9Q4CPU3_MORMO|nr:LysR family transcriptional regulator [Morganella morganii]BEP19232.1 LysR family transcriptional regulator [Morganella morganii subsp. sibonii]HDS6844518.1 LysR family transcriptional regulator [Morganella morganii subsp. morganii]EJD6040409.1 LysR family transcriptional regulator [Morganella morganii]EKK5378003.1 LysR family transcriptional regulator [Morganella morganii]ELB1545815.1 LysR family transcriptional regulator [Morganella morganii]
MANLNLYSQLKNMAAFVHTAETGSFTAAAVRMGVSKSATGKSVAKLEERLGVRLLHRTTRSVSLTEEGQIYYQSCLSVLDELHQTESLLSARRHTVSGTLRISLPVSYGRLYVMPVLTQLTKLHPELKLIVSFTDRRVDLIEENTDIAVRLGYPQDSTTLVARRLGTQHAVICASPDYLARRGIPQTAEALAEHDCLGFISRGQILPWPVMNKDGTVNRLTIRPKHIISNGEALRDAAADGMGIAYLTTWLAARDIEQGRLQVLPVATPEDDAPAPVFAIWPRSRDLSPRIRVVVDALLAAHNPDPEVTV